MIITSEHFQGKYHIDTDENNFSVVRIGTNQNTGEDTHVTIGHYSNVEGAVVKIVRLLLAGKETLTLKAYVNEMRDLIDNLISELKP